MVEDLSNILYVCVFILGSFLAFFFIKNKEPMSNKWLAFLNLTLALHFINLFLIDKSGISHFGMVFGLLYGPIIMFFVKSHYKAFQNIYLLHFIPSGILLFWICINEVRNISTSSVELNILQFLVFAHLLVYFLIALKQSKLYKKIASQTRSKIDDDKISLIQKTIVFITLPFIAAIIQSYFGPEDGSLIYGILMILISIIIIIGMFGIIYQGMENPHIFSIITSYEKNIASQMSEYPSSGLTKEMGDQYLKILIEVMDNKSPYKQDNLTIEKLSEMTEIPQRYLSQIINQRLNKNFFDFINFYRINDAKQQLAMPDKRISEIMYDIGFSSRSSFNVAFKKHTTQTPSQYRRQLNKMK